MTGIGLYVVDGGPFYSIVVVELDRPIGPKALDQLNKTFAIDGLCKVGVEAGFFRALFLFMSPAGEGDQEHLLTPALLANAPGGLVAVELRHAQIEQHNLRARLFRGFDRLKAVQGRFDFIADSAQPSGDHLCRVWVIVGYKNTVRHFCFSILSERAPCNRLLSFEHYCKAHQDEQSDTKKMASA